MRVVNQNPEIYIKKRHYIGEDKKGYYVDMNGYYRYRSSNRLVHRVIAEQIWGKDAIHDKVIHHKNYNKIDNSRENLQLMTKEEHDALHDNDNDYDFCYDSYEEPSGYCVDCGRIVSKRHHYYCYSCWREQKDDDEGYW